MTDASQLLRLHFDKPDPLKGGRVLHTSDIPTPYRLQHRGGASAAASPDPLADRKLPLPSTGKAGHSAPRWPGRASKLKLGSVVSTECRLLLRHGEAERSSNIVRQSRFV